MKNSKKQGAQGFTLIEILLALGILGTAVLCLFALLTPMLAEVNNFTKNHEITTAMSKVKTLIQTKPFDEISEATQQKRSFYFYKAPKEKVTTKESILIKDLETGKTLGTIIKITLAPSPLMSLNHPEAYLPIEVSAFIIPPRIASIQAVIIPIYRSDEEKIAVVEAAEKLKKLAEEKNISIIIDNDEQKTPGTKFFP